MAERKDIEIAPQLVEAVVANTNGNGIHLPEKPHQELRSAEANEMLERTPSWLMRWGMFSVVGVFALLFSIAALIKYPDTIEGKAIVTTDPLPIQLKATTNGRVAMLFVPDGKIITTGIPIAEIENNTGYTYIQQLTTIADSTSHYLASGNIAGFKSVVQSPLLSLGEAQPMYNILLQGISSYLLLKGEHIYTKRETNLQQQINRYHSVTTITATETKLIDEELKQAADRFESNEKLYKDKVISRMEYYDEAAKVRQRKLALEAQRRASLQNTITLGDNNRQLLEIQYDKAEKERSLQVAIQEAVRNLQNYIQTWKRQYLLIAPYHGTLHYLRPLQLNEITNAGDVLFTVIPSTFRNTAIINLPATGLGKVVIGQVVHLLLEKYPYQEYGYLEGIVTAINELPTVLNSQESKEQLYRITVKLPTQLITSYHKTIPFSPEMQATARIITKDRNLIQRLVSGISTVNK